MNIAEWLAASARLHPKSPALVKGTVIDADYATFARRAAALGAVLQRAYGIQPGDRVSLFMANCTEYLECFYAIWWIGAVAVPVNAKLHAREALWICENAGVKLLIVSDESVALLRDCADMALPPLLSVDSETYFKSREGESAQQPLPREPDDLAWLFYTSGTTGRPKGVMISHGNILATSLCYLSDVDHVTQRDCALYAAPMSHGAGFYNFIHVRMAARHVVPRSGSFDADEVLDLGMALGDVGMFAAPTMIKRLVDRAKQRGEAGKGLRTIVYGGGPMYLADIREAMAVMGQRFVQIYGQGESPMCITALPRECHRDTAQPRYLERLASVGTAQSAVRVRITGADGQPLPSDETGEIEVKGASVMLGYWNNVEATTVAIKDGWLRTGDVGRLDSDGFLTLTDRSKDMIISGGSNIYPREVEEVLLAHPAVRETSVVGATDPEWGEIVVACIVLNDGANASDVELDAWCLDRIARFKRPKRYLRLPELPKNNYGKVLKTELRETVRAQSSS
jgi:acyl-CoA synthetase (AMP-forming)/AMP-acid ligase II